VLGSACSAPLGTVSTLTVTGDRLLGLAASAVLAVLAIRRQVRWTVVHAALGMFVLAQLVTTALNARTWPQGPKFVTVYILGFACFSLSAECARGASGQRRMTAAWVAVAVLLSLVGTVLGNLSNLYQEPLWGTGTAQRLFADTAYDRSLFGARVTFNEWNLFSSFLLIPFTLSLWGWRRETASHWLLIAVLAALVFGLVAGVTRAAWLCMAGIMCLWWRLTRPRQLQVAVLGVIMGSAFVVQALALGTMPLWSRLFEQRTNIEHRLAINRVTVESWVGGSPVLVGPRLSFALTGLLLGHGAGSVSRLSILFPGGGRIQKVWTGNGVLFIAHDSGLLGLATLLGVVLLVWRRAMRTICRDDGRPAASPTVPLLVGGGALCFAYQFTHGLWLMYPYVYLGFLTAVTGTEELCPPEKP
jgi:hypothetical protein